MVYRQQEVIEDLFLAELTQVISCKLILKLVYPSPKISLYFSLPSSLQLRNFTRK